MSNSILKELFSKESESSVYLNKTAEGTFSQNIVTKIQILSNLTSLPMSSDMVSVISSSQTQFHLIQNMVPLAPCCEISLVLTHMLPNELPASRPVSPGFFFRGLSSKTQLDRL